MASTSKRIEYGAINYVQVSKNYFDFIEKEAHLLKGPNMFTRPGIEESIKLITMDPREAKNFIIENDNGRNRLYLKKSATKFLEVLPVEEVFDMLLKIHVGGQHCSASNIHKKISEKYSVPIFCSGWIVESCNVCNPAKGPPDQTPDETEIVEKRSNKSHRGLWRLNIIKDNSLPTNCRACFLLILKEDTTNFLVLRPIFESAEELALDLMKLFTEFGYPEKVCVPNMLIFYKKVFHMVFLINPVVNITVEEITDNNIFENDKEEVLNEIQNWTKMMDDTYWEQSCHIVQYKLNTNEKLFTRLYSQEKIVGIPFNEFFNYRFRTKMTWITPPHLINKTEPDVEIII